MFVRFVAIIFLLCLCCLAARADEAKVSIDYLSAEVIEREPPIYPFASRRRAHEGWVDVAFTVGADAAIQNVEVIEHSGVEEFVEPAIQAVSKYKYKAATLNGKPVDSLQEIRIVFIMSQTPRGATKKFVRNFRSFRSALAAEKFDEAADYLAKLRALKANNLYEDAFLNLAEYYYGLIEQARPSVQISRLDAATRVIEGEPYIAKAAWMDAMRALFLLEVKTSDYGAALNTFSLIPEGKSYTELRAELLPAVTQIIRLRFNTKPFVTKLELNRTGLDTIRLIKPVYAVSQLRGEIHRFQLICNAGMKTLEFVEDAEYQIPQSYGLCDLRIKGTPGTEFSLVQMPVAENQR